MADISPRDSSCQCWPASVARGRCSFKLPPDIILLICEFACDMPTDYLGTALVNRDFSDQVSILMRSMAGSWAPAESNNQETSGAYEPLTLSSFDATVPGLYLSVKPPHFHVLQDDLFIAYFALWSELRLGQAASYRLSSLEISEAATQASCWERGPGGVTWRVGKSWGPGISSGLPIQQSRSSPHPSGFLFCRACHTAILSPSLIESDQYQGGLGPAFLSLGSINSVYSHDSGYETQYTTGVYVVCDVKCKNCAVLLGKKYLISRDPSNKYKEGKILMEQALLETPGCCKTGQRTAESRAMGGFAFPGLAGFRSPPIPRETISGPVPPSPPSTLFCSPCLESIKKGVAAGILSSTDNLNDRAATCALLFLLEKESFLLSATPGKPSLRRRISALVARIFSGEEGGDNVGLCIGKRLGRLGQLEFNWERALRGVETSGKSVGVNVACILKGLASGYLWGGGKDLSGLANRLGGEGRGVLVETAWAAAATDENEEGFISEVEPTNCLLSPRSPAAARRSALLFLRKIEGNADE